MEGKWTKGPWRAEYDNDTGPGDEGFWEFYAILDASGHEIGRFDDEKDAKLAAQAPAMAEALEAHHAWSYAEHHSLGCFEARGVLCAHAESLTARALAAIRGDAVPDYKGRRSLTVWPAVEITESDEATARALVAEVLEHERTAIKGE